MKNQMRTILLLGIAGGLIAAGIALGQPGEVLTKAVRICLECIGIA